jgi:hypothetical protein
MMVMTLAAMAATKPTGMIIVTKTPKPVKPVAPKRRFRTREYNRTGSTSYTFSSDWDELCDRIDLGVESGCLNGGGIDEYVRGIGWVLCNEKPAE